MSERMRSKSYSQIRGRHRSGFTLIEAALATTIVGTGVVAVMRLIVACTQQNTVAADMTAALLLADSIQEITAGMPFNDPALGSIYFGPEPGETLATYDDVDDLDGSTFNPPIDSMRQTVPSLSRFTQIVSVVPIYPSQLNANTNPSSPSMTKGTYTGAVRVMVRVLCKQPTAATPVEVYRRTWVRVDH